MPRTLRSGRPKSRTASTLVDVLRDRNIRFLVKRMGARDKWFLFRFLFNKAIWDMENWRDEDSVLITEIFVDLSFFAEKDYSFMKGHWFALEAARGFIGNIRKGVKVAKLCIDRRFMDSLTLNPNQYFGLKYEQEYMETSHFLEIWKMGKYRKLEVPYIGVGYRDKGNCRNRARDGTPSFAEVASDWWYQNVVCSSGQGIPYSWADPPVIYPQWDAV